MEPVTASRGSPPAREGPNRTEARATPDAAPAPDSGAIRGTSPGLAFDAFVRATEPRLRRALVAAYGFEDGRDATAEALAYAWEHWERLRRMANVAGYVFRVAQSRRPRAPRAQLFDSSARAEPLFEPGLPAALARLTEPQRIAVVLVHGYGYTLREVAALTGIRPTTVHTHARRGLARLRDELGVRDGD
jgi:DNA-directed RNA polymerase specialized sigma24 family protein